MSLYYNWEEGVKIRKNIELLENWSHDVNMEAANNYLSKVISVADFLATSKQFLLQVCISYCIAFISASDIGLSALKILSEKIAEVSLGKGKYLQQSEQ